MPNKECDAAEVRQNCDRFDAERIETEGRKLLGDQKFEQAYTAGATADVEVLTPA
jgi:hypothetical protein